MSYRGKIKNIYLFEEKQTPWKVHIIFIFLLNFLSYAEID